MKEEFRLHIEQETEHLVRTERLSLEEARRRAHVSFGGVERFKESGRDARRVRPVEEFVRDLRHSLRLLGRSRIFASVSVLTLGLGIGAVSATFSILNTVVLQPLPYPDADRLVAVRHAAPGLGLDETGLSSGTYFHYRTHGTAIQQLALYSETTLNLAGDDAAQRIHVTFAGPDLFHLLGVRPVLGRRYSEADWTGSEMNLNWTIPILLAHSFWQDRFGSDSTIIGRVVSINDNPRQVVGVLPPDFAFPRRETQVWHMLMFGAERASFARSFDHSAVGRLRPGATPSDAEAEYERLLSSIEGEYPDATPARIAEVQLEPVVLPLKDMVLGGADRALWIIFGSMLLLLLVACANVANLFAVRGEKRAREVAIRTSLGAGRLTLVRLFVAESLLVSVTGAAVGLALASWSVRLLIALSPVQLPRLDAVRLDSWTVALAAAITVVVTALFGLLSLLRHVRHSQTAPVLRGSSGAVGGGRAHSRLLDSMVAAQVALTIALLIGSALMLRSYSRLVSVDPGFTAAGVLTIDVGLPYRLAGRHQQLYDEVADRMRRIPDVMAAGGISSLPLSGGGPEHSLRVAGATGGRDQADQPVAFRFIVPGYFQTMRTPIIEGIGFAPAERTEHANPVVISDRLAQRLFPDARVIGRQLVRLDAEGEPVTMWDRSAGVPVPVPPYTIAGIAADTHGESLQGQGGEAIYIPVILPRVERSIVPTEMSFTLRSELPLLQLAASARRAVVDTDPALSIARIRTMDNIVAAASARERFLAGLLLIAGVISLLLGAVGIYGIAAYTVSRRTPEIGMRVALGASPRAVMSMVLRQSLRVVLTGAAVGVGLGIIAGRMLRSVLFDVNPTDPLTLVGVASFFIGVALIASFVPALRAAHIEPTRALRAN
jgi:predicted permease